MLNLWQKNEVFASEVIQPLFDLANPNSELSKQMEEQISKTGGLQKIAGSVTKQGPGTIQVASMASIAGIAQTNQLLTGETQVMTQQNYHVQRAVHQSSGNSRARRLSRSGPGNGSLSPQLQSPLPPAGPSTPIILKVESKSRINSGLHFPRFWFKYPI